MVLANGGLQFMLPHQVFVLLKSFFNTPRSDVFHTAFHGWQLAQQMAASL